MREKQINKVYTEEFRKMAVDLSYTSEKPIGQICKELGLSGSMMDKFKNLVSLKK